MNNNQKINMLQFSAIYVSMILTFFLAIGSYSLIKATAVDGWISIILGGLVGFILVWIFIYIFNYEPDLPIYQKTLKLFGKKIGTVVNFILCILIFILGINIIYANTNFIISQFLSETPYLYVSIFFVLLVIYINTKGIEVLSRVALITIFFSLILYLISAIGLIPNIDIENLKPFLEFGMSRPIKGIFYVIAINLAPAFLLLAIPKNSIIDNEKYKTYISISYIMSIILMLIVFIYIIGNLGIHLASYYQFPEYMVLKRINFFEFINRIENLIITQWILESFISLSFIVYFISNTIKQKPQHKLISSIVTIAILIVSKYAFKNNTQYNTYSFTYAPYLRSIIIIVFVIIAVAIFLKRKKTKATKL